MSSQMVRVTGTNYVRDVNSMGLSNTNSVEKEEYYAKQRMLNIQKQELNNIKSEIDSIRDDMSEIKQMMLQLMGKNING